MKRKVVSKQKRRELALYGRSYYEVRRASGFETWGFLAPLPFYISRSGLHDELIRHPFRWQVLAIVYFRDDAGEEYREWCEITTGQGLVSQGPGLVPFMERALTLARDSGNHNHEYDKAIVLRPMSSQRPSMVPVLERLQSELGLEDWEISAIDRDAA